MAHKITRRSLIKGFLYGSALSVFASLTNALGFVGDTGGGQAASGTSGPLVLRVEGTDAIKKEFKPERYLDYINADKVERMLEAGVKRLAGEEDLKKAWLGILTGYSPGDKIAIKPNLNFVNHGYRYTITSPQLINAAVAQLVNVVGADPVDIYVYDLCKVIPRDIVRKRIEHKVTYVELPDTDSIIGKILLRADYGPGSPDRDAPIKMRERITDERGEALTCYAPKLVTEAKHIINMPLLTNHIYVLNSGALKNHYGTVRFSNHNPYPVALHGEVIHRSIVDLNLNRHIKEKTRLIVADALFGVYDRGEGEGKRPWKTFNNRFPESILLSRDPVAIDSVMASMVSRERTSSGLGVLSSEYLEDAMDNGLGVCELNHKNLDFRKIRYETRVVA